MEGRCGGVAKVYIVGGRENCTYTLASDTQKPSHCIFVM